MHLRPETLVDIADGTRAEEGEPHLQRCETCRGQLAELRAMMTAATDALDVPDPSPLFWEHLSDRVRRDVAAEAAPRRSFASRWLGSGTVWKVAGTAATVAIIAVLAGRVSRAPQTVLPGSPALSVSAGDDSLGLPAPGSADDASLALVAGLASQMDPEAVVETGLTDHAGGLDEMVVTLSAGERGELQRLLKDELAKL